MNESVLEIRDLSLHFETQQGHVHALRRIDLDVPRGEIVGVVGESGSGKSTLALAVMRLLPVNARITSGELLFGGGDLLKLSEDDMRAISRHPHFHGLPGPDDLAQPGPHHWPADAGYPVSR